MEQETFDLAIIGGGTAGMTAAVYGARANLKVLLLDENACGGLVNGTQTIENMPSYTTINGMELMQKMQEQVEALGVRVEEASFLDGLHLNQNPKVILANDEKFEASAVILATGRKPVPLEIGEGCEAIHYCSVCDGNAYIGKRVVVVGGGNSGFDEALALLDLGVEHITLIETQDRFFAAPKAVDALAQRPNAVKLTSTVIKELHQNGRLTAVTLEHNIDKTITQISCDGIFVFMGQEPGTQMFEGLVDLDSQGYILTDDLMATSTAGVFAAGDVRPKKYRQITTAMADGTIAALEAERYIHRATGTLGT